MDMPCTMSSQQVGRCAASRHQRKDVRSWRRLSCRSTPLANAETPSLYRGESSRDHSTASASARLGSQVKKV